MLQEVKPGDDSKKPGSGFQTGIYLVASSNGHEVLLSHFGEAKNRVIHLIRRLLVFL
jgi:hypothetical protein